MSNNLAKDQKYFNCSEDYELKNVSEKYEEQETMLAFLIECCKNGKIKYSTHREVYELIKKEMRLEIPVRL